MQKPLSTASPGVVKIRDVPLVQRRWVELCATQPGRWREIVDGADVVSEGLSRTEAGELVYYGTTSVLLPCRGAGGVLPDLDVATLAALLRHDPHVRLRALRIAHREAGVRAGSPVGTLRADLVIAATARGVVISVDVMAKVPQGAPRPRPLASTRADEAGLRGRPLPRSRAVPRVVGVPR